MTETTALMTFAARASHLGLAPECAVALAVERRTIEKDLDHLHVARGPALARLDRAARSATVIHAVSATDSDYVRHLLGLAPLPVARGNCPAVAIPMRLVARASANEVEEALTLVNLEGAVAWEVAATIAGRTMSEWAAWELLAQTVGPKELARPFVESALA